MGASYKEHDFPGQRLVGSYHVIFTNVVLRYPGHESDLKISPNKLSRAKNLYITIEELSSISHHTLI